jgi:hypothetical protein
MRAAALPVTAGVPKPPNALDGYTTGDIAPRAAKASNFNFCRSVPPGSTPIRASGADRARELALIEAAVAAGRVEVKNPAPTPDPGRYRHPVVRMRRNH